MVILASLALIISHLYTRSLLMKHFCFLTVCVYQHYFSFEFIFNFYNLCSTLILGNVLIMLLSVLVTFIVFISFFFHFSSFSAST